MRGRGSLAVVLSCKKEYLRNFRLLEAACFLRTGMGISTEQWRASIGTYNGGRGGRCRANQSLFSHHAAAWTTGEIMNTTPLTVQAGVAFVSLWMVLCAISCWWKKIESSHPTKLNRGSSYHWSKDIRATVSITVCVSLVTAAAVLLHCLTLLLIMAGDVELNPGPGMDTELTDANLSEMFEILYKAREKWYNIGLWLKLSIDDLSSIQRQNREDSDKCLSQMLKKLLETRRDGLTWNKLCNCLRSTTVDRNDVAEQIERQFNFEDEVITRLERKRPHPESDKGESLILSEISTNKRLELSSQINLREVDWKPIKQLFHKFQASIKTSLEKRKVIPKEVVATLKGYEDTPRLLDRKGKKPTVFVFQEIKEKCLKCESIGDFWFIIEDFFTFYSYVILSVIVESDLATETDRQKLRDYEREFDSYSCNVLSKHFTGDGTLTHSRTKIIVKIRQEHGKFSDSHLIEFKKKLASVLRMDSDLLHLNYLEPGCIRLTYHAPFIVEIAVFPLTLEQEDALKKLGVIWLECGKYHFPLEVTETYTSSLAGPLPLRLQEPKYPSRQSTDSGIEKSLLSSTETQSDHDKKMSEVFDPNHIECHTFDLSDLIQGISTMSEWKETYMNWNGEALEFSFKVERVDKGRRIGLKASLLTAYEHKREARFRGVLLCIRSKGKRDDNFLYHKFGKATKQVLIYNESMEALGVWQPGRLLAQ